MHSNGTTSIENESEFFHYNNLYIEGNTYTKSYVDIMKKYDEIGERLKKCFNKNNLDNINNNNDNKNIKNNNTNNNNNIIVEKEKTNKNDNDKYNDYEAYIDSILDTEDIRISTIEEDCDILIKKTASDIEKNRKKNLFSVEIEDADDNTSKNNKNKSVRQEAKTLQECINSIKDIDNYQTIKKEKFKDCTLNSYLFFKNTKKEIGKETNYIFNYRDNFLNDMNKIDRAFFKDYFDSNDKNPYMENLIKNNELVYEFSIYHPCDNLKTQQISILGNGTLKNLKDKIYCVIDEINASTNTNYNNNDNGNTNSLFSNSFFFIENIFYNDRNPNKQCEYLSYNIVKERNKKIGIEGVKKRNNLYDNLLDNNDISKENMKFNNIKNNEDLVTKFRYDRDLYSTKKNRDNIISSEYEERFMNDWKIKDLTLRIGFPYLYRHISFCDHIIMLTDVRFIDHYDNFAQNDLNAIVSFQRKIRRCKCDACNLYFAKYISVNDISMGDVNNALFLCENCIENLHGNYENKDSLKLVPYYHN